jgi:hypothetical protein
MAQFKVKVREVVFREYTVEAENAGKAGRPDVYLRQGEGELISTEPIRNTVEIREVK